MLTHCNMGQSRAPSLAMLALAKVHHVIPNESFDGAWDAFRTLWPSYSPGRGIRLFLSSAWQDLT